MNRNTSINAGPSHQASQAVTNFERNTIHNAGRDVVRNEHREVHHHYYTPKAEEEVPRGNQKKSKEKPKGPRGGTRNRWLKAQVVLMALLKIFKFVQFKRSFSPKKAIINDHSSMDFTFLSSVILQKGARKTSALSNKRSFPEIYSHLISDGTELGCPLYQPDSDLSSELQRGCIRIGDVGVITRDGGFDPLFNVCPSQNRCRNPSRLPDDFKDVGAIEVSKRRHQPFRLMSRGVLQIHRPSISYTCTADEGAILELPMGAYQIEARNSRVFRKLGAQNALNWYKYLLIDRDRDARNGSLLIVSGYIKSRNWGIAVFDRPSTPGEDYLHFIAEENLHDPGSQSPSYRWSVSGSVRARVGADSRDLVTQDGEPNQCIFLRGYQIALPDKEWEVLMRFSGIGPESSNSQTYQRRAL